jgi:hypothetical protein
MVAHGISSCIQNSAAAAGSPQAGINWAIFGLVLVILAMYGTMFGYLVRWLAKHQVDGQTAYMVVVGVSVTLIGLGLVIGWQSAAIAFACFAASGLPMVIEYVSRVHTLRVRDQKQADDLAKDLLK